MINDVELLDYCILAYQLHSQTLVCAIDPYGEQMREYGPTTATKGKRRRRFLEALDDVLRQDQTQNPSQYASCRGNVYSRANGWNPSGDTMDSIPGDYVRITPHHPGFVRQNQDEEGWIVYKAPASITDPISDWLISSYQSNRTQHPNPQVNPAPLARQHIPVPGHTLYSFEGVTGVTPKSGGAWSLMGFVLARDASLGPPRAPFYDIVVAFRGSRSGKLRSGQSFKLGGNPDWATNLYNEEGAYPAIAGANASAWKVHSGFAEALQGTLPTIVECLNTLRTDRARLQQTLRSVYVTGHSLGGALASCFASAVVFGNHQGLGQYFAQTTTPEENAWRNLELVTFAAPPFASAKFRQHYNMFVDRRNYRLDRDIVPKAKGVISVSSGVTAVSWRHTGQPITLEFDGTLADAHSPYYIRRHLQQNLTPPQQQPVPLAAWRAHDNETPWLPIANFKEMLRAFHQIRRPAQNARPFPQRCYQFKLGLGLYLGALMEMKNEKRQSQCTPADKTAITQFVAGLSANPFPPLHTIQTQFDNGIASIPGIKGSKALISMLKQWLALIAAEDGGVDWFPQAPSPQHAQLLAWFQIQ